MARPKGSGRKKPKRTQSIGEAQPREDLDLGSGQESEIEEVVYDGTSPTVTEQEDYEGPEGEDFDPEGEFPEKSSEVKDADTDQKIINKDTEPGGIGAPAIIKERLKSDPPKPPESQDIEYLAYEEVKLDEMISTLTTVLIEDPDASSNHLGPFIDRCMGRNPETKALMVARVPAKEIPINPDQILQYLGSVVQDHQALHSPTVIYKRRRWGYSFDRFFIHNGKKIPRCCYVPNPIHQAALMYEKMVSRKTRKPFARITQIKAALGQGTGQPMYKVLGVQEAYYRDLKRLFERHFLRRGDEALADDVGLRILLGGSV